MKFCRLITRCLVALLLTGALAAPAMAQTVTGEIRGTVRDSSGGVLPGVTVTATNTQTGLVRSDTTDGAGAYVFPSLPLGTYTVAVSSQAFARRNEAGSRSPRTAASRPTSRWRSAR